MRHTFHCSNGRGLETTTCGCTFEHCALFYSALFSLLSVVSLTLTLLAPFESIGFAVKVCVYTSLSIVLIFSIITPIGIYRRSSCLIAPFIVVNVLLLALIITTLIATVVYLSIQEKEMWIEMTSTMDIVLQSGLLKPIVDFLSGDQATVNLSLIHYILILSFCFLLLISSFFVLIHSLCVLCRLWRRFFAKVCYSDAASMDWMFTNLNGSYSATIGGRGQNAMPRYEEREWRRNAHISLSDEMDTTY